MPSLRDRQTEFHSALVDRARPAPVGIVKQDGTGAASRFDIYRNNRMVSLIDALAAVFPAVENLVGTDFFRAMAREFIIAHPPLSPVLIEYGGDFPGYVTAFEPAQSLDYLGDVARVEWAWHCAYHAADAESASLDLIAGLPPDRIAALRFSFHPSVHVVESEFPVISIWSANCSNPAKPDGPVKWCEEVGLIHRPGIDVSVSLVPAGRAHFLLALYRGETLMDAAGSAIHAQPQFDLSKAIADLLSLGIVTAYKI